MSNELFIPATPRGPLRLSRSRSPLSSYGSSGLYVPQSLLSGYAAERAGSSQTTALNGDHAMDDVERATEEISPSPGYSIFSSEWFTIRMGKYHKPPHHKKLVGGFRYNHQWNQLVGVSTQSGLVIYKSLWSLIDHTQLDNTVGQGPGVRMPGYISASTWTQTIFGFDPFNQDGATLAQGNGGIGSIESPVGPITSSVQTYNGAVYLDKVNGEMWIQNFAKVMTEFEIWWMSPKIITGVLPEVDWAGGENISTWSIGGGQAGTDALYPAPGVDGVTSLSLSNYGCLPGISPFNTRFWNEKWRVVKKLRHQVLPGGVKRIKYAIHYNKYLELDRIKRACLGDFTKVYIPGLTLIPMIVAKSGPVWNSAATFGSKLTHGPVDLRLHGFYNVHCKYVSPEKQLPQFNYGDSNLITANAVTNVKTMDATGTEVAYSTNP